MQAPNARASPFRENAEYALRASRKLQKTRPRQGARLADLRKAAGFTQAELAALVGETQQNIAFWEQSAKPPRSDVLAQMAKVLSVSIPELLDVHAAPPKRVAGPVGEVRRLFSEVSKLPRREQDKVCEFVSAYVAQYKQQRAG